MMRGHNKPLPLHLKVSRGYDSLMSPDHFERELRYQTMLAICRTLMKNGVLSSTDFEEAERYLRAKYQPIFTAA